MTPPSQEIVLDGPGISRALERMAHGIVARFPGEPLAIVGLLSQGDVIARRLVDKVKDELQKVIDLLESGETDTEVVQETLDEAVCGINDLQEEFDENDSEIETVARECIAATVAYILEWFGIPIDTEEAIRERDW